MPQDQALKGRVERRLPVIVVVSLAHLERASTEGVEWTYTDNVSANGARIFSRHFWEPGDEISITPFREENDLWERRLLSKAGGWPLFHRGEV